jgi:hypothetical protein
LIQHRLVLKKEWINYRKADNGRREAWVKTEIHFIKFDTKLIILFVYQLEDLSAKEEWEYWNPAKVLLLSCQLAYLCERN